MSFDARAAALLADTALAKIADDPLLAFRFPSEKHRDFARAFHRFDEVALKSGNGGAKTTTMAYISVAWMRGVTKLDGVELPLLGTPVVGALLVQGREQAKESSIKAIRKAIGNVPHHIEKNGNVIAAIWVKPDKSRSDRWEDWSVIRIFVEDGQSVAGMRLDFAWADEPPKWAYWEELRMRGRANRPFLRSITFTPIDKPRWLPIRTDFKGCEKGKDGKILISLTVYDNSFLSKQDIKSREKASKGKLQQAKLMGEWVDVTGSNPFDADGLKRWSDRTRDPEVKHWMTRAGGTFEYHVWESYDPQESYMVVADPSSGIEDENDEHDPSGIVVVARRKPRVVARFNGYLRAHELARLAVKLAHEYGEALLVYENNSGYGEAFFGGLTEMRGNYEHTYGNLYTEYHEDKRGMPLSARYGWTTTATTRGTIIGALQKAIEEDGLIVWSADAVESLKNVIVKRDGIRVEAGPGSHDEDMIILGIACHLLETYPARPAIQQKGSDRLLDALGARRMVSPETDPFAMH